MQPVMSAVSFNRPTFTQQAPPGGHSTHTGEGWRAHLLKEATKTSRNIRKVVAEQHRQVIRAAGTSKSPCGLCAEDRFPLDLVKFSCVARKAGHHYCTECVARLLRDSGDGVRHTQCLDSAKQLAEVDAACNGKLLLVVCPACRSPNVLTSVIRFHETFNRERVDSRLQFSVHLGATQLLHENFAVDRMCENQRRPFFGAFSSSNLLVLDFCGERSIEREYAASEIENVNATFERPNRSWVWLEGWSPDLSLNPKRGWLYARNFAARWPVDWKTEPEFLTFVRRRRLLRTRIRLNDEVRLALLAYFGIQPDNAE